MNSFYGVLGTPGCRFFDPVLANAITSFGKELLLWTRDAIERRGLPVLYGDTDSLFVLSGRDPLGARELGSVPSSPPSSTARSASTSRASGESTASWSSSSSVSTCGSSYRPRETALWAP